MSGVNSPSKDHEDLDGFENGTVGKEAGVDPAVADQGDDEESDDYDDDEEGDYEEERQIVGDEDDDEEEEDEDEEEGGAQAKATLTSLLLGNPNGPADGADLGDEEDEDEDEDEDDDEYVEDQDGAAPPASTKKRSIDEVADEDDAQGSKKVKS